MCVCVLHWCYLINNVRFKDHAYRSTLNIFGLYKKTKDYISEQWVSLSTPQDYINITMPPIKTRHQRTGTESRASHDNPGDKPPEKQTMADLRRELTCLGQQVPTWAKKRGLVHLVKKARAQAQATDTTTRPRGTPSQDASSPSRPQHFAPAGDDITEPDLNQAPAPAGISHHHRPGPITHGEIQPIHVPLPVQQDTQQDTAQSTPPTVEPSTQANENTVIAALQKRIQELEQVQMIAWQPATTINSNMAPQPLESTAGLPYNLHSAMGTLGHHRSRTTQTRQPDHSLCAGISSGETNNTHRQASLQGQGRSCQCCHGHNMNKATDVSVVLPMSHVSGTNPKPNNFVNSAFTSFEGLPLSGSSLGNEYPYSSTSDIYNQPELGVSADSVPHVIIVSPSIRRDIIAGKDINLASLLIPGYKTDLEQTRHLMVGDEVVPLKPLTDTRLHRSLTIQEFLKAFDMYKSVMCDAYPIRRSELDKYQSDVIDMSQRFGGVAFYEYHRAFSAKSAALLLNHNVKLDWSKRDTTLFCSIFSGLRANACTICASVAHSSEFCPQINTPKITKHHQ